MRLSSLTTLAAALALGLYVMVCAGIDLTFAFTPINVHVSVNAGGAEVLISL